MGDINTWAVLYGTIIPTFLCSMVFFLRICSRAVIARQWGWEDNFACLSWMCIISLTVVICVSRSYNLGSTMQVISRADRAQLVALELAGQTIYQLCLFLTKLSVLFFYRRVLTRKNEKIANTVIAIITAVAVPTFLCLSLLQCNPFTGRSPLNSTIYCFSSVPTQAAASTFQMMLSFSLFGLITPSLLRISWPASQKLVIFILAIIGGFGMSASIIHLSTLVVWMTRIDASWNSMDAAIWSVVECAAGIFCANLVASSRTWQEILRIEAAVLAADMEFLSAEIVDGKVCVKKNGSHVLINEVVKRGGALIV